MSTQAQDSLHDQLRRLIVLANKEGLYDAADFLTNHLKPAEKPSFLFGGVVVEDDRKKQAEIRSERTFDNFSRGLELIKAIRRMWETNAKLPPGANQTINTNIQEVCDTFDLNVAEWHYWCRQARV